MTRAHSRILACIHSRAFEHSATREESRAMTASTPASASSSSVADDVERLRRIARDAAEKTHDVSRRLRIAESALDDLRGARANARVATETAIEINVARGSNDASDAMKSDARRTMRATRETRATFGDAGAEGEATVRFASARADYLANEDEYEARVVTLEKVTFARTVRETANGVRVRARATPFGAEGVDACTGGVGGARRSHRLTGFGALGSNLIERCEQDSMGAVSVEYKDRFEAHLGVFTGNRQPEDNMGKVLAQASAKSSTSTRHVNFAVNASRCQSGEAILGVALTVAKTLPKTTRAVVGNAWGQVAVRQPNAREDLTEWGIAASVPPTKGAGLVKNAGWGIVAGKPANRGGVQAEAFLRIGSDGEEPGSTLIPGVVISTDDRGHRQTTLACRAHLLW